MIPLSIRIEAKNIYFRTGFKANQPDIITAENQKTSVRDCINRTERGMVLCAGNALAMLGTVDIVAHFAFLAWPGGAMRFPGTGGV